MALTGSTSSKDVLIPKGVVIAYPIVDEVVDVDGGIDLGYCQEAEMSISEESRQVYSARDSSKTLVVDKVTKTDHSLPLTLMSVNPDNLAMLFRGAKLDMIQVVGYYDSAAPLAVTSPAALNRAQKLPKRWVGLRKLNFDGGTVLFTKGHVVTGGTSAATGKIVWVTGTVASGTLYLVDVDETPLPFADNEVLASDDTPPGAAVANGVATVEKDIVLTDSAQTTRYVKDADYGIDEKSGTIFYLSDGDIVVSTSLKASFDFAAKTEITIERGQVAADAYQIEVLPFADETENRFEWTFWKCTVKADTTIKLITVSDEEISVTLTFTPLGDGPGATTEYPIYRCILV